MDLTAFERLPRKNNEGKKGSSLFRQLDGASGAALDGLADARTYVSKHRRKSVELTGVYLEQEKKWVQPKSKDSDDGTSPLGEDEEEYYDDEEEDLKDDNGLGKAAVRMVRKQRRTRPVQDKWHLRTRATSDAVSAVIARAKADEAKPITHSISTPHLVPVPPPHLNPGAAAAAASPFNKILGAIAGAPRLHRQSSSGASTMSSYLPDAQPRSSKVDSAVSGPRRGSDMPSGGLPDLSRMLTPRDPPGAAYGAGPGPGPGLLPSPTGSGAHRNSGGGPAVTGAAGASGAGAGQRAGKGRRNSVDLSGVLQAASSALNIAVLPARDGGGSGGADWLGLAGSAPQAEAASSSLWNTSRANTGLGDYDGSEGHRSSASGLGPLAGRRAGAGAGVGRGSVNMPSSLSGPLPVIGTTGPPKPAQISGVMSNHGVTALGRRSRNA